VRDDDKAADPTAQDRFARLLTGVAPAPPGTDHESEGASGGRASGFAGERQIGAPAARAVAALEALSPGRRAMKPLIAVAVCVALLAAFLAWRSRPAVSQVGAVASAPAAAAPGIPSGVSNGGAAPQPALPSVAPGSLAPSSLIVVAVQGRVQHPGLVRLPPGARVADAIEAAGGVLPGTDTSYVNLAQKVTDGQLIVIGKSGPAGGSGGTVSGGDSAGSPAPGQPIDLNTATAADLDGLPGIGPSLAAKIIDYRTQHGGFHSVDELRNVSGIGDAKFAEIKDLVTV
jgi:competence protein ComEA